MKSSYIIILFLFILTVNDTNAQGHSAPTFGDQYSKKLGRLRLSSTKFDLGRVKSNEYINDTIRIYNSGKSPMKISITQKIPVYMRVIVRNTVLNPGGYGYIALTYDCSRRNELGFTMDQVQLVTNDSMQLVKNIYVTATIEEYFPPSVLQDSLRAKIRIPEQSFSYNTVRQGTKISHDYKIFNDGNKNLLLRKVRTGTGNIKCAISKNEILPGDSALLHVEFDTAGILGKDRRQLSLFTNDALMSEFIFELTGEIIK
jgi:hypothetical protein